MRASKDGVGEKGRVGRPPGPPTKSRLFRFGLDEYAEWEKDAKASKKSMTDWLRSAATQFLGRKR